MTRMIESMRRAVLGCRRSVLRAVMRRRLPHSGYPEPTVRSPRLDGLDDASLAQLNRLLPWHCFVVDGRGRRFGDIAWDTKRAEPQVVPDRRIALLDQRFGLAGKRVLEVGCFEGVHTAALCQAGAAVTAIDSRVENSVKTLVRCWALGLAPTVAVHDVERRDRDRSELACDVCHHVGVLYHLRDPVAHLLDIGACTRLGLMLDTHVATDAQVDGSYEAAGRAWPYRRYGEHGRADPFSGMYDHAKWLTLAALSDALRLAGFADIDVAERRDERNGLRVLLFARKAAA